MISESSKLMGEFLIISGLIELYVTVVGNDGV
jgi:hypothetical protein